MQKKLTLYIIYTSTTKLFLKKGGGNPRERKGDCGILLLYLSKLSKELPAFTPSLLGRIKTSGVPNPWKDYCLPHPSLSVYKTVIAKLLVSWYPGFSPSIHMVELPMFTSLLSWDLLWPMAGEQRRKTFKRKINFKSQWTVALLPALCLYPWVKTKWSRIPPAPLQAPLFLLADPWWLCSTNKPYASVIFSHWNSDIVFWLKIQNKM